MGEFDGKIKYGRELQPEKEIEDVLFDEKRREDAVRDSGKQVVRWIWADLSPPLELKSRLERAFARGRRRLSRRPRTPDSSPWTLSASLDL